MDSFETKKADAIKRERLAFSRAKGFEKQVENLNKKKKDVTDAKSRIPSDLPEEIQEQVNEQFKDKEEKLKDASEDVAEKIEEAIADANDASKDLNDLGKDLDKQGASLKKLKDVPLVGTFLENKGKQLNKEGKRFIDLSKEAHGYSDRLSKARNSVLKG